MASFIPSIFRTKSVFSAAKRKLIAEANFSYQFSNGLTPVGSCLIAIAYVSSYFFEERFAGMHFDTLNLRVFMAICFIAMIFRDSLPQVLRTRLPVIWLAFLLVVLPYCYGTILLTNAALSPTSEGVNLFLATEYILSCFFLVQLVFHLPLILIVWIGANILILSQLLLVESVNFDQVTSTAIFVLPFFLTILLIGGLINRRLFLFQREKEQAVWNVANAIAHQLRTPLATVSNLSSGSSHNLDTLVDGYKKAVSNGLVKSSIPERKIEILDESLQLITEEVQHSRALIDILIANSRPFEYHETPNERLQIAAIAERAIESFPYNNPRERALVSLDKSQDFEINALENMILHVFFNLIGNAVEFSQKRFGEVKIWFEKDEKWNKAVVWDSGIGIPRKCQHQIFDPFFSRDSQNGTGIGLSFCKSVLEGMGGRIECDSVENEYCRFTLYFPHPI